ncbi:hypothetical protein AYO20_08936 [Fonsecaea nubica]|uniref:Uncharacterized protein n=1 Tax=Fonsecaea nubica TaxID=856822 RepID=A0A178CM20_9EURO|nr:hypothetical protein AYO20_08936 [Fonsecaea nubica]OAL30133.1 hypothetical protein AYO20_08936 [Fonsecaea nubica]
MHQMLWARDLLDDAQGRTALLTGAARGIGSETASLLNKNGSNIVITDLPSAGPDAEALIQSMQFPERAIFVPASVTEWSQLVHAFKEGIRVFGRIDIVVANAGIMESRAVLEVEADANGDPAVSEEASNVIDVNLKGTLDTLRLGMHYIRKNPLTEHHHRGSIILVTSTSGYFGFSGNAAYVASKHGILGLLRAAQPLAEKSRIRVNAIAPSFTPTRITAGFGDRFEKAGVASNTTAQVAEAISYMTLDPNCSGACCLVAGKFVRELEHTRKEVLPTWFGEDLLEALAGFRAIIQEMNGYPLPPAAPQN